MDKKAKSALADSQMVPILRRELIDGTAFPSDVFVRLRSDSYLLVARMGDLANLKELQLKDDVIFLYVEKEFYKGFVDQSIAIAGVLINRDEITLDKKATFISNAVNSVSTELVELGVNSESLAHARSVARNVTALVGLRKDFLSIINSLASHQSDAFNYSMAVSLVSIMIAKVLDWTHSATLEKISLGCLFQDIGLKEIPQEILLKPRHELSFEERRLYETHPLRGAEILRGLPEISEEIISIVYQHHENANGSGFPRRMKDTKMLPLARVVSLANAFCELTIRTPTNPRPKSATDALHHLDVTLHRTYNTQAIKALRAVLEERFSNVA